ncbi:tenascin-like, partial [Saccostrea cucullata]|uniref:tenascin-like n=1 Tax=Saccostrea cuccullata TaxID=36930 RepID=UPI002ED50861
DKVIGEYCFLTIFIPSKVSVKSYSANRMLYEDCILDDQCNGTSGASVCKTVRDKGLCVCASNYIEDKDTLRCRRAEKHVFDTCKIDEQCTGTENAGVCRYDEQMERDCNEGYIWHKAKCIQSERLLFDTCEYDVQCNGTEGANNCTTFGERKICFCKTGHLEFQGRCIAGKRHLGDPCEITKQCLNEEDTCNVICGNNSSCSCKDGYFEVGQECLKGNLSLGQSCVESSQCTGTEDSGRCVDGQCSCEMGFHLYKRQCIPGKKHLFLLVGAGVLLLVITVSIITCLVVCRGKLKARSGRLVVHTTDNVLEDHNYYTYATHGNIRDTMESQIPLSHNDCSYTGDTLYDTTHHAEEQTTENLYDVSEPLSTFRDQASSEGVYMYNHLHDKETAV